MKVMGIAADALRLLVEIDYELLRGQKAWLLEQLFERGWPDGCEEGDGLLCLIDAIQDFAVDRMGKPEREVFNLEDEKAACHWRLST